MSDRQARNEKAQECRSKMAEILAEEWRKGHRDLVMETLRGGLNPQMRKQWRDDLADCLPADERKIFNDHVERHGA